MYRIAERSDLAALRDGVRRLSSATGFDRREGEEMALVATELGTNILKYSAPGEIRLAAGKDSLEIVAEDAGAAIPAIALEDGCDAGGPIGPEHQLGRGGFGAGLGAIQRLSDHFEYHRIDGRNRIRVSRAKRNGA